tara:strand:+ start:945 stop:1127 length:183 start_codon:yes stop_codon:yes gene_type:complete
MFQNGDLVEFVWTFSRTKFIGIVISSRMYTGHVWYRVRWNDGVISEVAEVELRKIKTDKK